MKNHALNSQLDQPANDFSPRFEAYQGAFENGRPVVSYDAQENLGIIELRNTGLRFAFSVKREAKPLAVRSFVAEYELELREIETVANGAEIEAALGAKVAGKWLIRKEALEVA